MLCSFKPANGYPVACSSPLLNWSHSLDEQSGLGLFFTGTIRSAEVELRSSDSIQTALFLINISYTIPKLTTNPSLAIS